MGRSWRSVAAVGMLAFVLPPRLLPHPVLVQVTVGTVALLQGYWLAAAAGVAVKRLRPTVDDVVVSGSWIPLALTGALLVITVAQTQSRTDLANERLGLPGTGLWRTVLSVGGAVGAAVTLLVVLARWRRLSWRRRIALVSVPVAVVGVVSARPRPDVMTKGEEFLAGARDAAAISAVTGRDAETPTRIYVSLGETLRLEAEALDHEAVLVVVPTGSGWVNPRVVRAAEELYDGDLTTIAVQYSSAPSWLAYVRGGDGVQQSAASVIGSVRGAVDDLPEDARPHLLAYGESLGAWGLLAAMSGGLGDSLDATLLAGVPGDQQAGGPDLITLNHADDPIPGWTPSLSLTEVADVVSAEHVPVGYGHRYGSETVTAWCQLLRRETCSWPDR